MRPLLPAEQATPPLISKCVVDAAHAGTNKPLQPSSSPIAAQQRMLLQAFLPAGLKEAPWEQKQACRAPQLHVVVAL